MNTVKGVILICFNKVITYFVEGAAQVCLDD